MAARPSAFRCCSRRIRTPEFEAALRALAPEIFVVVAYGRILPPSLLAIPALGPWNVHASLLPRLRGAAPIQWSIIRGDSRTGVAIMRMEAGLDTGPVAAVAEPPSPTMTRRRAVDRLARPATSAGAGRCRASPPAR